MVAAVKSCWINTMVTQSDIRRVYYREPCLVCVLAKRNKDCKNRWSRKFNRSSKKKRRQPIKSENAVTTDLSITYTGDIGVVSELEDKETEEWAIGECISMDNIGPISPSSLEGYSSIFMFRDTKSRMVFIYPIKSANEDQFLIYLNKVLSYFLGFGFPIKILRTDYFKTFLSNKSKIFYQEHNITHQSSVPYEHWQNAVERDVQTCKNNVSAVIHGQDLLRADTWTSAVLHWAALHNSLPHATNLIAPNQMLDTKFVVDAQHQFRYVYGDIVCFTLPDRERLWAFDVKNEVGIYTGDQEGIKGGILAYQPYQHNIVLRGGAHRLRVSPIQLMQWYARRKEVREQPVPYHIVKDAVIDLLSIGTVTEDNDDEPPSADDDKTPIRIIQAHEGDNDPIPILPLPNNHSIRMPLLSQPKSVPQPSDRTLRPKKPRKFAKRYNNFAVAFRNIIQEEQGIIDDTMQSDDTQEQLDKESRILWDYNVETMHDPIGLNEQSGEMEFLDAIKDTDAPAFVAALLLEIHALIHETKTLQPISRQCGRYIENKFNKRVWKIATTFKAKRKKKSNGEPDKYKVRGAARGDQLTRAMRKQGIQLPTTYSPTIRPLTFSIMLQLAVILGLSMATMDIKTAYLNVLLPDDEDWIVTQIHPKIAELCGLDPEQHYRIGTALYGLPDSGRRFYYHYKDALILEGYTMAQSDQCLFFKITDEETTYIIIYVDDTFIFSNHMDNVNEMFTKLSKHYTVTLDTVADSFLGINLEHLSNGTIKMTQPKLLKKLFMQYPPMVNSNSRKRKYNHPYGPALSSEQVPTPEPIERLKYLRLLGLLMYLTKSRPDILAAVSFASTKSQEPTDKDYLDLYYIVEYLRTTKEKGHILHKAIDSGLLQLYCEVDASYLLHPDSRGHTGYCMGFNGVQGTFYNRSMKQQLVATSSTHAEMRAIFTLVKDIMYIITLCKEIKINLHLPAIIMEDNSAVVTVTTDDSAFAKKCKHFLMLINYVREQVELGIIQVFKINGTLNRADMHTKPLRNGEFSINADGIMGTVIEDTISDVHK